MAKKKQPPSETEKEPEVEEFIKIGGLPVQALILLHMLSRRFILTSEFL